MISSCQEDNNMRESSPSQEIRYSLDHERAEKNRKRANYLKELAQNIRENNGARPPAANEELEYAGRAQGFLVIPDELIFSGKHLSPGEKIVWLAIFLHNWNQNPLLRVSWPGRERLSVISGKSIRQVTYYLGRLKRKKLLMTRRRLGKSSLYLLNDPPESWMGDTKKELDALKKRKKADHQERIKQDSKETIGQAECAENCTTGNAKNCAPIEEANK
jgi:hypothetical protein